MDTDQSESVEENIIKQKYSKYADFSSSDELGDDDEESYASNSNLSFNEIEHEYETKHLLSEENFDKHSVELGVNPEELVSERYQDFNKQSISKESDLIPVQICEKATKDNTSTKPQKITKKILKEKKNMPKYQAVNHTVDIEQEVSKRNIKLQQIKQNSKTKISNKSSNNNLQLKILKLKERNKYLKIENQKCKNIKNYTYQIILVF